MKNSRIILIILMTILIHSCTNDPKKEIIGKWARIEKGVPIYEFFEDGSINIFNGTSPSNGLAYGAIYEFPAEDSIRITSELNLLLDFEPYTEKFHFQRGNLIFTTTDGNQIVFERIN